MGKARKGWVNSLGSANLNNSGGLWNKDIPTSLVPGPGLIYGGKKIILVCSWGCGLCFGWFAYEMHISKLFIISRN